MLGSTLSSSVVFLLQIIYIVGVIEFFHKTYFFGNFVFSDERLSSSCPLRLEKLEKEPFSAFGCKNWKTIFFTALAGKTRIVLGPKNI